MRDVDADLVRACQRGERGALEQLIRATYPDVYSLARRMVADPELAADVTQEVFLRVSRSVLAFRAESAFGGWLHRVTVNAALTALKRRGRLGDVGDRPGAYPFAAPDDTRHAATLVSPGRGPEDEALRAYDHARLEAALAALPAGSRAVVVLRDVEGLSTRHVAALLEVSEDVVKVRLHRAHRRLRELLAPEQPEEGQ